ncbi:MAG: anaerobic ribonucleoside-triphosphate reductase activating protein [Clostridia bacterium]|nr:anaerobic ribonucleoside-triphosphate reductase activating protein [Clostridia bacterium]
MQIKAIQKLTLLDFPGKTAATVFTCGCNLRCPFCHNASLVIGAPKPEGEGPVNTPGEGSVNTPGEGLAGSSGGVFEDEPTVPESELFALLEKRRGLLDGVAITGGEPLLQPDLPDFIRKIREMGFMVKLDTNGFLPGRLEDLIREGLVDYVAVDFKQTPGKYGEAVGIPQIDPGPLLRSVRLLQDSGVAHEFRTTMVKGIHELSDITAIAAILGPGENYFLQMYVDSGDVLANRTGEADLCAFTQAEAEEILDEARKVNPNVKLRGL